MKVRFQVGGADSPDVMAANVHRALQEVQASTRALGRRGRFDESKIRRHKKGSPKGGQFAPKEGPLEGGGGDTAAAQPAAAKKKQKGRGSDFDLVEGGGKQRSQYDLVQNRGEDAAAFVAQPAAQAAGAAAQGGWWASLVSRLAGGSPAATAAAQMQAQVAPTAQPAMQGAQPAQPAPRQRRGNPLMRKRKPPQTQPPAEKRQAETPPAQQPAPQAAAAAAPPPQAAQAPQAKPPKAQPQAKQPKKQRQAKQPKTQQPKAQQPKQARRNPLQAHLSPTVQQAVQATPPTRPYTVSSGGGSQYQMQGTAQPQYNLSRGDTRPYTLQAGADAVYRPAAIEEAAHQAALQGWTNPLQPHLSPQVAQALREQPPSAAFTPIEGDAPQYQLRPRRKEDHRYDLKPGDDRRYTLQRGPADDYQLVAPGGKRAKKQAGARAATPSAKQIVDDLYAGLVAMGAAEGHETRMTANILAGRGMYDIDRVAELFAEYTKPDLPPEKQAQVPELEPLPTPDMPEYAAPLQSEGQRHNMRLQLYQGLLGVGEEDTAAKRNAVYIGVLANHTPSLAEQLFSNYIARPDLKLTPMDVARQMGWLGASALQPQEGAVVQTAARQAPPPAQPAAQTAAQPAPTQARQRRPGELPEGERLRAANATEQVYQALMRAGHQPSPETVKLAERIVAEGRADPKHRREIFRRLSAEALGTQGLGPQYALTPMQGQEAPRTSVAGLAQMIPGRAPAPLEGGADTPQNRVYQGLLAMGHRRGPQTGRLAQRLLRQAQGDPERLSELMMAHAPDRFGQHYALQGSREAEVPDRYVLQAPKQRKRFTGPRSYYDLIPKRR